MKVIEAVAETTGRSRLALPPFGDVLDPDALDTFVASAARDSETVVSFRYAGCSVRVDAAGGVEVVRTENSG